MSIATTDCLRPFPRTTEEEEEGKERVCTAAAPRRREAGRFSYLQGQDKAIVNCVSGESTSKCQELLCE